MLPATLFGDVRPDGPGRRERQVWSGPAIRRNMAGLGDLAQSDCWLSPVNALA
jgi:hypothetical protein